MPALPPPSYTHAPDDAGDPYGLNAPMNVGRPLFQNYRGDNKAPEPAVIEAGRRPAPEPAPALAAVPAQGQARQQELNPDGPNPAKIARQKELRRNLQMALVLLLVCLATLLIWLWVEELGYTIDCSDHPNDPACSSDK
ncbi:hypothetical protein LTR37_008190 [Vermiconidia calcicola]|uniref:Uncharacterized protein n=1 Tax=Vermiconidia calcicola TaxID=1690605 RepID=A0ACC3NBR1_9PEZI|nr:hypothetical protein LTR37_008190 [Vermiconidia calcicola]